MAVAAPRPTLPRYTPTAGYRGPDSFTVRATVAGESVEHVVQLTVVDAVDDPPACNFELDQRADRPRPGAARRR